MRGKIRDWNATREQVAWLRGVQRALSKPGGEGLAFYTIGDAEIVAYNPDLFEEDHNRDLVQQVAEAVIVSLPFPANVSGVCG